MSGWYDFERVYLTYFLFSLLYRLLRFRAQKWQAQPCVPINQPDRQERESCVDHARQRRPCMRKLESQRDRVKSRGLRATSPQ